MQGILQIDLNVKTVGIVVAALVPLAAVYRLLLYPYVLSPVRKAPGPRGSLLSWRYVLYGEFPGIMRAEAGVLQREWAKLYGTVVRAVGPLGIQRLMFLSPVAMQKVLVTDWVDYPRPSFMRNILGLTAGYGLLTVTGDEHRMMRRAMNPAFSIPSLTAQTDMYYKPLYDLVDILKGQIKDGSGNVFYMYDWMSKVTLDIICLTAFGYESDSLHNPENELADAYHRLIDLQSGTVSALLVALVSVPGMPSLLSSDCLYNHRHWLAKWGPLVPASVLVDSMRRIKRVSASIITERNADAAAVAASDSTLSGKKDVMSLLMQSRMREASKGPGYKMTDAMMMEQLTFLGAGHETTASGLAWTLWLLATHPDIQTKLREEVTPVLAENATPDFRTLKGMEYLEHVVMESLRVFPPVPMTIRQAGESDYIDGIYVPKGTLLYIAVYIFLCSQCYICFLLHSDICAQIRVINTYKGFWGEDAEAFRPERWVKLSEAPAYHPMHSFQTFIAGPHNCIGKTMAIVEMKAVLAIIIANFEFAPAYSGQKAHPTAAVTMKPADNLPLLVRPVRK